jgi:indole-3-glycerol phosphate synthase
MPQTIPDILSRIVEHKREEFSARAAGRVELERRAQARISERRDFAAALRASTPAVIAELKKASPSKGLLAADFQPARIAAQYEAGGAAALSVLTDEAFFQGSLDDLETARGATGLPALRKDFTIDEFHVVEAAAHGADAILLIAAILSAAEMRHHRLLAASFGMASIVEVHGDDELDAALDSGAEIVGVNNRDLHTFEVTLATSLRLAERIPTGLLKVSESGIHGPADVLRLVDAGYQAFLVGEHLMKSPDPAAALRALLS